MDGKQIPLFTESIFSEIDQLVDQALLSLQAGDEEMIGRWMMENHSLLQQLSVSCPELDHLVSTACVNGAFGAKLTGAGRGGNMIALIPSDQAEEIEKQITLAGAKQTWITQLKAIA